MHPLPIEAQLAPIYGILPADLDNDGGMDLLLVGNDYGMEVQQGRADAFVGLALQNKGNGNFKPIALSKSRFFVPGDAKALVSLDQAEKGLLVVASQNNDSLKVFEKRQPSESQILKMTDNEVKAQLFFEDSTYSTHEFYWGNSFQSQSSRAIPVGDHIKEIRVFDNLGKETRKIAY
jgi:hypothetical protein